RLFPTNVIQAPTSVTTPLNAYAFLGQFFSLTNTAANLGTISSISGLPPGITNAGGGVISGVPNLAGTFPVMVTASNTLGVAASVVLLQVIDTGTSVVREVWTGVPGTSVASIPVNTPATFTNTLGTLEGITGFGTNYGERIRGFFTAPTTGNYYFWI